MASEQIDRFDEVNRPRPAIATGAGVGAAVVGLAASAHAAAGGVLAPEALLGAFVIVTSLATYATRFGRWSFWRLVVAVGAAQPLLHSVLGAGHGGHHQHHQHEVATAHADTAMAVAHVVVTLIAAVALRWGVRWVRTLPAVARSLVVPRQQAVIACPAYVRFAPLPPLARRDLAVLAARGSRGPPR